MKNECLETYLWSSILSVPFVLAAEDRIQSFVVHRLKTTKLGT